MQALLFVSCAENGLNAYEYRQPEKEMNKTPHNYYLDATAGNDENDGTTPATAWKTLGKVGTAKFEPGDTLFLKRGEVFEGVMEFSAEGTKEQRVVIDAYGDRAAGRPMIKGNQTFAVRVHNSTYVTIQNLEIENSWGTLEEARANKGINRRGLLVEIEDYGTSNGMVINNLYIHDVKGSDYKSNGGSAIAISNKGKERKSRFNNMVIENCHIKNCVRNGISWGADYWKRGTDSNWYPNTNTIVRNNLIEGVPGDGIVPTACDNTLIEYNVMRDGTNVIQRLGSAAAGIWPWSCSNTTIQFNDVSGMVTATDGQGYDADYNCTNTVIQYNYSHHNNGGFLLLCDNLDRKSYVQHSNPVIKYNISIDDGYSYAKLNNKTAFAQILFSGPTRDALFERNIIHSNKKNPDTPKRTMVGIYGGVGYAENPVFRFNIFYAPEEHDFELGEKPSLFENNWYLGLYKNKPQDVRGKTQSDYYQKNVLKVDKNGFQGLYKLMEKREVGGKDHYFIKKEAIEAFFAEMEKEESSDDK